MVMEKQGRGSGGIRIVKYYQMERRMGGRKGQDMGLLGSCFWRVLKELMHGGRYSGLEAVGHGENRTGFS